MADTRASYWDDSAKGVHEYNRSIHEQNAECDADEIGEFADKLYLESFRRGGMESTERILKAAADYIYAKRAFLKAQFHERFEGYESGEEGQD